MRWTWRRPGPFHLVWPGSVPDVAHHSPDATSPFPTGPLNAGNPDTACDCL